ncbi:MAG: DUF2157 domain-containing protein [Anaerolineales bacterium]|nr:MAG: DUF2157 domain-containing protein [Anaerolineales bacterium]
MAMQELMLGRIEEWVEEGLISAEQAEVLRRREAKAAPAMPARRVRADEILVYLGSLVVLLAVAILLGLNWRALGSAGRVLSVLVPTLAMLGLGWRLRGSETAQLRRGAQALWLAACLLSVLFFAATFYELGLFRGFWNTVGDPFIILSCLLATGVAGAAFALLPSIAQSIAFHLCGGAALITFLVWLDNALQPRSFYTILLVLVIGLIAGGLWLALSEWLRAKGRKGLVTVSQVFGALTVLFFTYGSAVSRCSTSWPVLRCPSAWQKTLLEVVALVASIAFIAASVKRHSRAFLYSGAAFLFLLTIYVNFEHFADRIGMPIALLISGALLIGLGLGTGRLSRRIRPAQ